MDTLIDVRSSSEFAAGHIAGSLNVPMDELEARIDDLKAHGSLVLVCRSGRRAEMCRSLLAAHGMEAEVLAGGVNSWDGPVVVSARTRWSLERQVRLGAGLLILISLALAAAVSLSWAALTAFVGAGLIFAGCTDICLMGSALSRMPWNRPQEGIPHLKQ
jgi:rhodanese-related sulfurtransferase